MAISSLNKSVAELLGQPASLQKSKKGLKIRLDAEIQAELKEQKTPDTLEKAIMNTLNQSGDIQRLAFESDPIQTGKYHSLYRVKYHLIPDKLLKRIAVQNDLVACIVQARQNHMSAFARPRPDRFSTGFTIELKQDAHERIETIEDEKEKKEEKNEIRKRIAAVTKKIMTCGNPSIDIGGAQDRLTFPQYMSMSVRNAIVCGRIATEVLRNDDDKFVGIRVIDAGTIYRPEPRQNGLDKVREQAKALLAEIKGDRLDPDKYENGEYAWVQVIDDRPVQAFTDKECLVHNFYAVPDIEMDGYPVTPIDTAITAITTYINITTQNKLYFQNGRAARGMLIIKSDDVDETIISRVRQQFNAQINSVNNSHRMPVFGIGVEDDITWSPIDNSSRDAEFQYLSDMNSRVILSAFQMSPDELPGWSYLSKGTNNQSLSEGNNEYRLEAARDLGIRPLLAQMEDFLNQYILPLFDETLAKLCVLKLVGLDSETAEKESVRIQQDMPVHLTYDEVLEKVEKKPVGKKMGGEMPINPQFQSILDKYMSVGQIIEHFFGIEGASKDPNLMYFRDPFFFQMKQMQQAEQQMAQQAQMQQQQAAQQPQGAPGGQEASGDAQGQPQSQDQPQGQEQPTGEAAKPDRETTQTENQKQASLEQSSPNAPQDLTRSIDMAMDALSKSERDLPPSKRKLLGLQKTLLSDFLKSWSEDSKEAISDIVKVTSKLKPTKQ